MERLYGRGDVIDRARASVERALAGEGGALLFTGEPGIGKSTLAAHVAAEATARNAAVAWGRCWEAGGAPAYWPWIQIFRGLGMDDDPFAGAMTEVAAAVGAAEARFAAFDRAVRALKARAARAPLALVLDDLHAADAPSLLLLLLLARALRGSPILVVGAYRDAEARLTPEVTPLLAKIARESEVLPLRRLGAEDVALWARDAGGEEPAELYRLTEGHPLFVVEALRLDRAAGAAPAFAAASALGLGAILDEHLGRLSAGTRAVLEAGAVLGRDFSATDVAAVMGDGDPDRVRNGVHEALAEAAAVSIIEPTGEPARFRFSHMLLRDRIYRELVPSSRARLHARAATAVLARGDEALAEAVHHLFEGGDAGSAARVAEMALAAADSSLSRLAFEDAARLARRALGLRAPGNGGAGLPEPLLGRLRLVLAESVIRLGQDAEGKALCVQAAGAAAHAGAPDLLARAALVYSTELASGTIDPQMIALLRGALAALDERDSPVRARVMARLAAALTPPANADSVTEILALMSAATAMARRLEDRHALLYVLQFAATVALLVPDDERLASMQETVQLAAALDQRLVLLQALPAYIAALLASGQRAQAEALLPRYEEVLADSRQAIQRVRHALVRALFCALRGDFAEADRLSAEALATAEGAGSPAGVRLWLTQRLSFALMRAKPELLAPDEVARLISPLERTAYGDAYVAWALIGMGRREEAAVRLRDADISVPDIPSSNLRELLGAAEVCVLLRDAERGETIYPRLLRAADRMFWHLGPGALVGPTARTKGDLALLIGRAREAVGHYDEAIAFCQSLGAPALVDLCRARREVALASAGRETSEAIEPPAPQPGTPPTGQSPPASLQLRREGDVWAITASVGRGDTVRVKHAKGFGYLCYLVEQSGRPVHVLELAGIDHPVGDAGPVLDPRAKQQYRHRLDDLRDQLAEAERFGDIGRVSRIEAEIEAIAAQLAGAVGLGGRDRRAASAVERTRINVQRCLKDAIDRVAALDPALGRYLSATVKSGTYCAFTPL